MTFPTIFANLAAGNQPASLLDTMFNLVGAQGAIPCTASGTNAITCTPITNYYLPGAYADYQIISFVAANSATGAVTIQLGALAFVNLYMPSGLQANSGDILANGFYICAYNGALNSGSGGFQVFNASTPSVVQPVQGTFKNLKVVNGGTPTTQIAVTADQIMLGTSGGGSARVSSVSVTISMSSSGANGIDSGSVAANTWYSVWVIYNGSTIAGLASTSATSPTFPSGYIYYARVGWMKTASASTNLMSSLQLGRQATWQPAVIIAGPAGSFGNPVTGSYVGSSLGGVVPVTASLYRGIAYFNSNNSSTSASGIMIVAPNNSYGGNGDPTNPPPIVINPSNPVNYGGNTAATDSREFSFVYETGDIYWAVGGSTAAGTLLGLGWEDNI